MTEVAADPTTYQLFIAGEWVDSVSGETFESRNPADTRDVVGRFQQGTKADVAMALRSAVTEHQELSTLDRTNVVTRRLASEELIEQMLVWLDDAESAS